MKRVISIDEWKLPVEEINMIITNVILVDAKGRRKGNVLIRNGIIKDLDYRKAPGEELVIDGQWNTLMPSFIDLHCHLREPGYTYKEDMESGMKAALKGGYTHLVSMANTSPIIDDIQLVEQNKEKARSLDLCALSQVCALTKNFGNKLVDFSKVRSSTNFFSNDGKSVEGYEVMKEALHWSKLLDFTIATHCEPEEMVVQRDLELLRETGGNLHICHVSKAETVEIIRRAKEEGLKFTCEVTPHHLFDSNLDYKVNPPFGTEKDRRALVQAIKDGIIDVFATDHAPHTLEDKQRGLPGVSNIEVAFSMYWKILYEEGIALESLSKAMSYIPSKILGLNCGVLEIGREANLVLVDVKREVNMDVGSFISKSRNNPFHGRRLQGEILMTIKGGVVKYVNR